MRLRRLQLVRYGRFSGQAIDFPAAERDFHFIVGPNEAGKSTIRKAIAQLLFGMPRTSPLGFVHGQSELRLGGSIENGAGELEFERTKGTKQTLRSPLGAVLPDTALAPFLGTADPAFFEKMFGLDRTTMLKGGEEILDASKDVGQLLFQSAAGIASLGTIRDALASEASRLWAPRKSADRAWYVGHQLLDEASAALKEAVVRTKAWADTQAAVMQAEERFEAARKRHDDLETRRSRLERVRRLAPHVNTLRTKEAELRALGEVLDLPADASSALDAGQADLSSAEQILRLRNADVERLDGDLKAIVVDPALLALKDDIEALEAMRHQCRNHAEDIRRRGAEVGSLMEEVRDACSQLDWPCDEDALHAILPSLLELKAVSGLIRDRGAIEQAAASDSRAVAKKQEEIARLRAQLEAIPRHDVPAALRVALSTARKLRQTETSSRCLAEALAGAEQALETAEHALAPWRRPLPALRSMVLPSVERLAQLKAERQVLASDCRATAARLEEGQGRVRATTLAAEQYAQTHRIVSPQEVREARSQRDRAWEAVKHGDVSLEQGAPTLDAALRLADRLVDAQLGSVTESAELQGLQQRLRREQDEQASLQQASDQRVADLSRCDRAWEGRAAEMGLPGLHLDDAASWLARRENVLAAAAAAEAKRRELSEELAAVAQSVEALRISLVAAGVHAPHDGSLEALCGAAEAHVAAAEKDAARTGFLSVQLREAEAALSDARASMMVSGQAYECWRLDWQAALGRARLANFTESVAMAEAAVALVAGIQEKLAQVKAIRRDRIDTMQSDLGSFSADARRLAARVDDALLTLEDTSISTELSRRLAAASASHSTAQRIRVELNAATGKAGEAREHFESVQARLRPLFERAGVATTDALLSLIERSDRRRGLTNAIESAKENIVAGSDGLSLPQLAAEVDGTDVTTLQASLGQVSQALTESVDARATLATELSAARSALAAISGSADAAVAESRRQEALACMADASDRYLKVATASKLLRWAIERYRDRKQGPMLSRASAIFSLLTLGGFGKLIVDYEKPTPSLAAMRAGGRIVQIEGMSEGTCDQLYLALRLAALELHLEHATPLPFIADDLFVNFDDTRAEAGLRALGELARRTQVVFLSHHDHLVPIVEEVFGPKVNIVSLQT